MQLAWSPKKAEQGQVGSGEKHHEGEVQLVCVSRAGPVRRADACCHPRALKRRWEAGMCELRRDALERLAATRQDPPVSALPSIAICAAAHAWLQRWAVRGRGWCLEEYQYRLQVQGRALRRGALPPAARLPAAQETRGPPRTRHASSSPSGGPSRRARVLPSVRLAPRIAAGMRRERSSLGPLLPVNFSL